MATQITNYQCPACTGPLHFVGESGRLECDYCGSSFDIAEIEAFYAEKEAKAAEAAQKQEETEAAQKSAEAEEQQTAADGSDWDASGLSDDWGADAVDMKAYCCPSCGAELLCDATTAATSCPYCGNPSVLPGQFAGILKPDFVLPFKLSKEDAIKALKKIIDRHMTLKEFTIQAISKGSDDMGKVHMQVEYDNHIYYGFGANTDIIAASVEAYIDCINKFKM